MAARGFGETEKTDTKYNESKATRNSTYKYIYIYIYIWI